MRMMLKAQVPVEKGNEAFASGKLGKIVQDLVAALKPEAAYFFPINGQRAMIVVFDMTDASQIPVIVEPLFSGLNASVEFKPVMNLDDLQAGMKKIAGA